MSRKSGVLAVGNFDSNTGYAWKLMERLWCELSLFYEAKNYQTYVVFPTVSETPECLTEHNCIVEQEDFTSRSFRSVIRQASYIRNKSIKVLYLTDQETKSFRFFIFRLCGVRKIIVHDHTPGLRTRPGGIKKLLKVIANRLPLFSCTACFAVSPYVVQRLIEVNGVPRSKVYCVTNGIDIANLKPIERKEGETVRIVTVARASYYKGIDFALRVIRSLVFKHECRNIRYELIGDGPDLAAFQKLAAELEIESYVVFHGAVQNVAERLEAFDIAFHPSKGEAMSLAILEYMRAGIPVVSSNNPSVSSALKHDHDSIIYQEGDVDSAAKALCKPVQSFEYRNHLGKNGQSRVQKEFSTDAMLLRFRDALSDVAGKPTMNS